MDNVYTCEHCGKTHYGEYGSGRFCSAHCARMYSKRFLDSKSKKTIVCEICGKPEEVNIHSSEKLCGDCKVHISEELFDSGISKFHKSNICKKLKKISRCTVCGSGYNPSEGCTEFCKRVKITGIRQLVKWVGFDKSKIGTIGVFDEYNRVRNIVYNQYWIEGMSCEDISKYYGITYHHCISQTIFKILDIPIKTLSESGKDAIARGKRLGIQTNTGYRSGWYKTWDDREIFLRSTYERDYAEELDKSKIYYEVESLRIRYYDTVKNEYRTSIPDFYIPESNTIVEIKSTWTFDYQNMIDKRKAYYRDGYNFKLILEHIDTDLDSIDIGDLGAKKTQSEPAKYKWMYNTDLKKSEKVNILDIDDRLKNGWILGRKMKF